MEEEEDPKLEDKDLDPKLENDDDEDVNASTVTLSVDAVCMTEEGSGGSTGALRDAWTNRAGRRTAAGRR